MRRTTFLVSVRTLEHRMVTSDFVLVVKRLPTRHLNVVYIFWSFEITKPILSKRKTSQSSRVLLKPVPECISSVAYYITAHEQHHENKPV